jgi:outer membrane lipoprotein carrier protein
MPIENSMLELTTDTSASYGTFSRSYKLSEKLMPFLHSRTDIFFVRRSPVPAIRGVGIVILLFVFLLLHVSVVHAEPLSLEQLSSRMQEIYEKTTDLKARFIQEVTIKSMKKTEREEGTVTFKNPRMMLWDYLKPKAKKLVINAQKAWLYIPEDRMVYVQNADEVYRSRMAVRFLSGIGKLAEDFQIRFSNDGPLDKEGNYRLALTAKETGSGIDRLDLTVDGKTFQITECRFEDTFGNATRLRFSDIRLNTGFADKFFIFTPPPGVEVVPMTP